jgi:hypothetical protein
VILVFQPKSRFYRVLPKNTKSLTNNFYEIESLFLDVMHAVEHEYAISFALQCLEPSQLTSKHSE